MKSLYVNWKDLQESLAGKQGRTKILLHRRLNLSVSKQPHEPPLFERKQKSTTCIGLRVWHKDQSQGSYEQLQL